jgi:hypothetical protein
VSNSWIARQNRRGCFIIAAVLLLIIAAIATIGLSGDPINEQETDIPVQAAERS